MGNPDTAIRRPGGTFANAVEPLGVPGVARKITAGSTTSNMALTSTCRRVTMRARGANIRFTIGSGAQTATTNSHVIVQNERLDFALPADPNIAVLRVGSVNGVLELLELS